MDNSIILKAREGDRKSIARCISLIENKAEGLDTVISSVTAARMVPLIGITGPPGAGKSTLVDALLEAFVAEQKKVAVVCVDPSSPFNKGALLGDRIRMSRWYNHPLVYIRSLASRGSMGGLHPSAKQITAFLKGCGFDLIILETVGVGQSEIEIARLADVCLLVLVPEAGDEIQFMKAGLMEVADIFVVNKADRPGASFFSAQLKNMLHSSTRNQDIESSVVSTVATTGKGVEELKACIASFLNNKKQDNGRIDPQ
jgi:LAO/AO transport system kinase